jgi:hypothetical protein
MAIKQVANPVAYSVPDLTKWSVVQWKEVPLKKNLLLRWQTQETGK